MRAKLITSNIWDKITKKVKKHPKNCLIAVAYFGTDGSKYLPLKSGSALVIDFSDAAIKSGQTNPMEIERLLKRGVEIHSVENLHAKIFVIGRKAFIGSTNVSAHSDKILQEAVIEILDKTVVSDCRKYIKSRFGEVISPEYVKRKKKLYRKPKFKGARRKNNQEKSSPLHRPLWAVSLENITWDEMDSAENEKGLPKAKERIASANEFGIDEFLWVGNGFLDRIRRDHLIVQVFKEGRKYWIYPAGRLLHIQRYKKGRSKRAILFVETDKRRRRRKLDQLTHKIGEEATQLKEIQTARLIRNKNFAHKLLNAWTKARQEI